MRIPRAFLLLFVISTPTTSVLAAADPGHGEPCAIAGLVSDPRSGPVEGATITVVGDGSATSSSDDGTFCLRDLAAGQTEIVVWRDGYALANLAVEVPTSIEVELEPAFDDTMVVTATRTAKPLLEVPIHLQLVDRELIERSSATTLAEAVTWTSGLRIESTCQNCNQPQVRMLGLDGPYTQILLDSQPTVSSLAVVYGLDQLPARLIDSIEIVKGGGSATYGAGAVAGVVNLIPHHPTHRGLSVDASFGSTKGEPRSSVSALGDWTASSGGAATVYAQVDQIEPVDVDGDGFSEVARRSLEAAGLRAERFVLGQKARIAGEANLTREDRRGGDQLDRPPHEAEIAEWIATDRWGASVSWAHTVTGRFDYRLVASIAETERETYYGTGRDPNAYGSTDDRLVVLDGQVDHFGPNGTITWGSQFTSVEIQDEQPAYGRSLDDEYQDLGLFVQDDRKIGRTLSLLYGLRLDDHSRVADPIASPRLALMWAPRPDMTARASISNGFRPPVLFDEDLHITLVGGGEAFVVTDDPDLKEETSTSFMAGALWSPTFSMGSGSFEVNLFRTELEDLFHVVDDDDPSTPARERTRINFGEATVEGIELNAGYRPSPRWSFDFGWVFQRGRFSEPEPDFGSREFFRTPEQYGLATVQGRLPLNLDLFAGAAYTGPMLVPHYAGYVPEDELVRTPSTMTVDIGLSRLFPLGHHGLTVTGGVKNLFDEFQEDLDQGPDRDPSYVYGPRTPRTVFVSLRLEL